MKTKIITTIGPASDDEKTMRKLAEAGASIFRLNTKYGSKEQYEKVMAYAKEAGIKVLFDVKFMEILSWLQDKKFDYFALSFAESAEAIQKIRQNFDHPIKLIAKIENETGFQNIDELIEASDGIMVARGDLGKNISFERVPIVQKIIIKKCNEAGKMVITATEMLLSMTESKVPERAEASDIANAILDGSNCLMLSEETAIGQHPVLAVQTMRRVIEETEKDRKLLV